MQRRQEQKIQIRKLIKQNNVLMTSIKYLSDIRENVIFFGNYMLGTKYLDIGSGRGMSKLKWKNLDVQTDGSVIDENTEIGLKSNSTDFVYCSHFFEHISDKVAKNILNEVNRVLRPGGVFRIVVPEQQFFIDAYVNGDKDLFKNRLTTDNLNTWHVYGTDTNSLEQLLIGVIAGIHNKNHQITKWPFEENKDCDVPIVTYPFQEKISDYYCGPPPGIADSLIKQKLSEMSTHDFVMWILTESNSSQITKNVFPSWHKNDWPIEKIKSFSELYGFSSCVKSKYADFNFQILSKRNRESIVKEPFSLYINLIK